MVDISSLSVFKSDIWESFKTKSIEEGKEAPLPKKDMGNATPQAETRCRNLNFLCPLNF